MFDRFKFLVALTVIAVLSVAQAGHAAETPTADTVVATVDDTNITLGHMIALRATLPPRYSQVPADILFDGILDQLIQQTLLMQSPKGKPTRQNKLTIENERRAYIAGEIIQSILGRPVTEDDLNRAYQEQYADDGQTKEYRAAHILVETEDEAKMLVEELAEGANFAELAKKHSTGPSGPSGGDLGWFSQGLMVEPFFDAVVDLSPGQVSQPIKTQFGWHVIKLHETRVMDQPKLDDVRTELEEGLQQAALDSYLDKLTKAANIARPDTKNIDPEIVNNINLLEN